MPDILPAWTKPNETTLDFIIVGAGAGGAPLAARLAERGYTVLVTEMGPGKPDPDEKAGPVVKGPDGKELDNTQVPLLHTETSEDPRYSLRFFVKHFDGDPHGSLDPKTHEPEPGTQT